MTRVVLAAIAIMVGISAVVAQGDPIAARKALMKENSAQGRIGRDMIEGKRPFDLAAAKKVLATYVNAADKAKTLFPESSKSGDTAALPVIWEKKADFDAMLAKLGTDSKAAEAKVTDLDSFKAVMTEIGKDCGGCHQTYRKRSS